LPTSFRGERWKERVIKPGIEKAIPGFIFVLRGKYFLPLKKRGWEGFKKPVFKKLRN